MKRNKVILCLMILLFSYSIVTIDASEPTVKKEISSPINVTTDEDFVTFGFEGSGTESSPYKIENLKITALNQTGIRVGYTSKHFVIRNCHVTGGGGEIGINVAVLEEGTGKIENNLVEKCDIGISVHGSDEVEVIDNTNIFKPP